MINNSVKVTKNGKVYLVLSQYDDYVGVEIHDTGPGIQKEK